MKIRFKLGPLELLSDTSKHQLLILLVVLIFAMQIFAWTNRIDTQVFALTSSVITALVGYAIGREAQSSKGKSPK